jgi:hypothetical protein
MSLVLGKQFDRSYSLRFLYMNVFHNIHVFFNKKSPLVLYNIDKIDKSKFDKSINIKMFKNINGSNFCETFLDLHNYKKTNLDIVNQFHNIKTEFSPDIIFICNESLNLAKIDIGNNKVLYDTLTIYGFSISGYVDEYLFLLTERQHINQYLEKKIVRTVGLEIGSVDSINYIKDVRNNCCNTTNI